jgi:N6-adenosine-specific RNA methylase IME4
MFLKKIGDYYYIVEKVKGKFRYLKSLGKISKEEANKSLEKWKARLEIKGIYRTIIIDPPWKIDKIPRKVRPNQKEMDYKMMSIEEIKEFPLNKFVSPDGCHVYLWTTHKHLPDAFEVLKAWNVKYQCLLVWLKNVGITPFSFMYSTELILFGTIGHLSLIKKGVRLDFKAKVREHSRKPDEFYKIVRQVSPEPRIDIFSREKREGYDSYGHETDKY